MPILAMDLDGTALSSEGRIVPQNMEALRQARGLGWHLCFVTGRSGSDTDMLREECSVAHTLIVNSGGKGIDLASGETLWNHCVPEADARALVRHCMRQGWQLFCMAGGQMWLNHRRGSALGWYERHGIGIKPFAGPDDLPCHRLEAFMVCEQVPEVLQYIESAGLALEYVASQENSIDITRRGVNKRSGLEALLARLGEGPEGVVAMGNYDNDLCMMDFAGVGVAVRNAPPHVQAAADYVTAADHNGPAVAEVVRRFVR